MTVEIIAGAEDCFYLPQLNLSQTIEFEFQVQHTHLDSKLCLSFLCVQNFTCPIFLGQATIPVFVASCFLAPDAPVLHYNYIISCNPYVPFIVVSKLYLYRIIFIIICTCLELLSLSCPCPLLLSLKCTCPILFPLGCTFPELLSLICTCPEFLSLNGTCPISFLLSCTCPLLLSLICTCPYRCL
jgi:hypothetical protein